MVEIPGILADARETIFPTRVPQGAGYDLDSMRMARAALLGNLGATLIAAGQGGQSFDQRAALLGRLGQGPAQASEILAQGVRSRYVTEQTRQLEQERADKAARDAFFRNSIAGITGGAGAPGVGGQPPGAAPSAAPATSSPAGAATPGPIPLPIPRPDAVGTTPDTPAPEPATTAAVAARTPAPPPITPPQQVAQATRPGGGRTWWEQLQISPQMAVQIAALPDSQRQQIISKLIADRATPREVWTDVVDKDGKLLGQRNSLTGKYERNGPATEIAINSEKGWNELNQGRVKQTYEAIDQRERTIMPQVRAMHQMLVSGQVNPNAMQGALMPVRSVLSAMGLMSPEEASRLSDEQLFQKLSTQVLPNMRPPGSGSSSDRDIDMFMRGNVSITDTKEGALKASAFIVQSHAYQSARAELMHSYAQEKGTLVGFEKFAEQRLGPVIPVITKAEQLAAIPKGTLFKDPQGRFQVKMVD